MNKKKALLHPFTTTFINMYIYKLQMVAKVILHTQKLDMQNYVLNTPWDQRSLNVQGIDWGANKQVGPRCFKMFDIFNFFSKQVERIEKTCDMFHLDKLGLYVFPNCVFLYLEATKTLGGEGVAPTETCTVIIEDGDQCVEEQIFQLEVQDSIWYLLQ